MEIFKMKKITNNPSLIKCGNIIKSKNGDNLVGIFRGKPLWIVFENNTYEEDINKDFPNEYYKSKNQVPRYRIHKNRKPAGYIFLRKDIKDNNYLFCLLNNTYKKYYIFNIKDDLSIKENSDIFFDIKGDFDNQINGDI
jgi:hypothetical protein